MSKFLIILGLVDLSLILLTVAVYWLFVDRKIKDKKALFSRLTPICWVIYCAALACCCINFLLYFIVDFAIATKLMHPSMLVVLFLIYLGCTLMLAMFMYCLRVSIKRGE